MREIKFRAWDKKENKWLEQEYYHLIDLVGNIRVYSLGKLYDTDNIIELQQYTGLKDKNGKEIYEGDILGDIYEGGYIGWCDKCKSFQYFSCLKECMSCLGDVHWYELLDEKLEVIGNIYENPELIN